MKKRKPKKRKVKKTSLSVILRRKDVKMKLHNAELRGYTSGFAAAEREFSREPSM